MSDNRETIADIVAEMRRREKIHYYPKVARNIMHQYAYRIEAAWKREKAECEAGALSVGGMVEASRHKQVGNAAAMRRALVEGRKVIEAMGGYWARETLPIIDAALSAPPRNCDRFADDTVAQIAFLNEVCFIGVTTLKDDPFDGWTNLMKERYSKWLFATAIEREGGAK